MPQWAVDRTEFELTGPAGTHTAKADSGSDLEFGFCTACGSPLTKTTSKVPELIFVTAGSLDDPSVLTAPKPVFESGRPDWDRS